MAAAMKIGGHFSTDKSAAAFLSSPLCRSVLLPHRCRIPSRRAESSIPGRCLAMAVRKSPKRLKYEAPPFSKDGDLLYVKVDPSGVDRWKLEPVIEQLKEGAVGVIPTDTVYAIVCDMNSRSAIEHLRRYFLVFLCLNVEDPAISHLDFPLSILCRSLRDIDVYTTGFPCGDNQGRPNIFRAVKHCLPGPYTFILTASKNLPKQCTNCGSDNGKKSIGVRLPDDPVAKAILEKMDAPLISTSVKSPKEDEWILDPVVIADVYGKEGLDFIVDAGLRIAEPSTVVDMTGTLPKIIRLGKGPKQPWMVSEEDENAESQRGTLMSTAG
ncbi:hypothetical protein Cgig2_016377 [Carnegiea gigantea]|uniref:Threonylcarbamoyl-AMP synthase n=1 Tax=Carnegiea gigantea TaxID=171969 RepID=A0A9Q1Q892_9CARY|nr:hypothetical protein Cgig2_016377 [Carnegiea gigantea]